MSSLIPVKAIDVKLPDKEVENFEEDFEDACKVDTKECSTNTLNSSSKISLKASIPPEDVEEEINTANAAPEEPQVNLFSCYIGPCREDRNAQFNHPEFMICYKDPTSSPTYDNSMMRYFCCPLFVTAVEKDGKTSYELRTGAPPEQKQKDQNRSNENSMPNNNNTNNEEWRNYYQTYSDYGTGGHHQNPWNFLYHYCCSCPPQMMHHLHCQGHQQGHHCFMSNCGYQNYSFPGSAMG